MSETNEPDGTDPSADSASQPAPDGESSGNAEHAPLEATTAQSEPAADEATPEPAADEATPEPAASEATPEPAASEATPEPPASEATPEPPASEAATEPAADEAGPESAADTAADAGFGQVAAGGTPAEGSVGAPEGFGPPPGGFGPPPGGFAPPPGEATTPGYVQTAGFGQAPGYGQGPGYGQQPSPWAPPPGGWPLSDSPSPILVSFAGPAKQNRLTVLVRVFMAIPHLIVLYILNLATEIVALIGWFAALFTGSLPEWAHTFITGVLRWQTRVYSYLFLLTDAYPPFDLEDAAYPVRLVTRPTRLNRFAVFFRIILVIPAALVGGLALWGAAVISFFAWLITLVAGQLPPALHQSFAAVVRYVARYQGYFLMVTSDYPGGLYGDPAPFDYGLAPTAPSPAVTSTEAGSTEAGGTEAVSTEAGSTPGPEAATPEAAWRLTLTSGARAMVTVILIVGVLGFVGYVAGIVAVVATSSTTSNIIALAQVEEANSTLAKTIDGFPAAVNACNGQLTCVTAQDRKLGSALEGFAGTIQTITYKGSASAAATRLVSATKAAATDLNQLGSATSVAQYQNYATNGHAQQDLDAVGGDYQALITDLERG